MERNRKNNNVCYKMQMFFVIYGNVCILFFCVLARIGGLV